jgi:cytochrome c biogenesis protein ResB
VQFLVKGSPSALGPQDAPSLYEKNFSMGQRTGWLMEGEEINLSLEGGDIRLALVQRHQSLPFSLVLKDFRKIDYPGTSNPASYESDVLLEDQKDKIKIEKTISMNKPLDYKGYRIFQSSYIQDPNYGEASIFTVAKNPGIPFIYWSSCIIFFGAFFQFFLKPNTNGKKKGKSA